MFEFPPTNDHVHYINSGSVDDEIHNDVEMITSDNIGTNIKEPIAYFKEMKEKMSEGVIENLSKESAELKAVRKNKPIDPATKVEEVDYTNQLSADLIDKYRLAHGEIIPVVYK